MRTTRSAASRPGQPLAAPTASASPEPAGSDRARLLDEAAEAVYHGRLTFRTALSAICRQGGVLDEAGRDAVRRDLLRQVQTIGACAALDAALGRRGRP